MSKVLYHADGRVSETSTANIAIVRDGTITTPPPSDALAGVSLGHLKVLATAAGITWIERSLTRDDLAAADEILLTSTPFCLLPATYFDGVAVGSGSPGVVFSGLLKAWSQGVDLDIADQALACAAASRPEPPTG
jgi:branched-chain amino acid aminotransferase